MAQQILTTSECVKVHQATSWQRVKACLDSRTRTTLCARLMAQAKSAPSSCEQSCAPLRQKGAATIAEEERSEIDKRVFEWVQMEENLMRA